MTTGVVRGRKRFLPHSTTQLPLTEGRASGLNFHGDSFREVMDDRRKGSASNNDASHLGSIRET